MGDTRWDEVGERFNELGRRLQQAWSDGPARDGARDDLRDAGQKVQAALDDLGESINRAVGSEDVRSAARDATSSVADALASTLRQVADWIDTPRTGGSAPTGEDRRGAADEA